MMVKECRRSYRTDDGKIVSYTIGDPYIDFTKGPSFVTCELCGRQIPEHTRVGMMRVTICRQCILTVDDEWCDKHGVNPIDRHEIKIEQGKARNRLEEERCRMANCCGVSTEGVNEKSMPSTEPTANEEGNGKELSSREMWRLVILLITAIAMFVMLFVWKGSCP